MLDTLVYEFCKRHGTSPEYGCGENFLDFLTLTSQTATDDSERSYYKSCLGVSLERQIGNRYFVTATKILFLKKAAVEFLKYTGKKVNGNNGTQPIAIALLRIDGIMFYHVYADLVNLQCLKNQ